MMMTKTKKSKTSQKKRQRKYSGKQILGEYVTYEEYALDPYYILKVKDNLLGKEYFLSAIMIDGIDIFHYSQDEQNSSYRSFGSACASIDIPYKFVWSHINPDLTRQKDFLDYKYKKTEHPFSKVMLEKRYKDLEHLETYHEDRQAYMLFFGDTAQKTVNSIGMFSHRMEEVNIEACGKEALLRLLQKVMSFGGEFNQAPNSITEAVLTDSVEYEQSLIKIGGKYATSVVVSSYPANLLDLDIAALTLNNDDTTITIDCSRQEKSEIIADIKRSLDELHSRGSINQRVSDARDTQTEYMKVGQLYDDLANGTEQIISGTLRFYLQDSDLDKFKIRLKKLFADLEDEGMTPYVPVNQMQEEYFALTLPSNRIKTPFPLYDTFARQYPFYYQKQLDPQGLFFGQTETGGLVCLNTFTRSPKRPSFDLLAVAVKGGGKSITLKTMLEEQLLIGNKAMVLDIEGEYMTMAQMYGGQIIHMTKGSCINPLEINQTIDLDAEQDEASGEMSFEDLLKQNYTSEISRIKTFLYQIYPELTSDDETKLEELLGEAFREKGITSTTDITSFRHEDFPKFSDMLRICEKRLVTCKESERPSLDRMRGLLRRLSEGGAYDVFDNYTNVEINSSSLIVFDVRAISEMDEKICNAQLFNIISMMWTEICKNVAVNKNVINPYDRRYVIALIDEAHRFISERNPQCTLFIEKLVRRSRKYYSGLWFATQSILDLLPENKQSAVAETIKKIFTLVQYKVVLKQDSSSLEELHRAFPQFTMSELKSTTSFVPGQMLLALDSNRLKLHCTRKATDLNLMYMGTSHDVGDIVNRYFAKRMTKKTQVEYGREMFDNDTYKQFIESFFVYVHKEIGVSVGVSQTLDEIILKAVTNLADSLVAKANDEVIGA